MFYIFCVNPSIKATKCRIEKRILSLLPHSSHKKGRLKGTYYAHFQLYIIVSPH